MLHVILKQVEASGLWSSAFAGPSGALAETAYNVAKADILNRAVLWLRDPPYVRKSTPAADDRVLHPAMAKEEDEPEPEPKPLPTHPHTRSRKEP
jgi:hypothetical protein